MATILCVDDEPGALQVFRSALERQGHRVVAVTNAPAALNVLGRGGVDLVISDYQMPEMSGIELVERLREEGLDLPVIMVTGHGSIEHAVAAMKAGAVDYITKPLRTQQLQLAVTALAADGLRAQCSRTRRTRRLRSRTRGHHHSEHGDECERDAPCSCTATPGAHASSPYFFRRFRI